MNEKLKQYPSFGAAKESLRLFFRPRILYALMAFGALQGDTPSNIDSEPDSFSRAVDLVIGTYTQEFSELPQDLVPSAEDVVSFPEKLLGERSADYPAQSKNDCAIYCAAEGLKKIFPEKKLTVQSVSDSLQKYVAHKKIYDLGYEPETIMGFLNDYDEFPVEASMFDLSKFSDEEKVNILKKLTLDGYQISIPVKNSVRSGYHNVVFKGWDDAGDIPMSAIYNPYPSEFLHGLPPGEQREGLQVDLNGSENLGNISLPTQELLFRMAAMPGKYANSVMLMKKKA